jgi:DNA-binding response OmpR family regulator
MLRFLLVDDEPDTVQALHLLLVEDGHEVAPFTCGAAAIDALSRERFDAVVTDLDMPVDGHTVVRAAREHQPHACVVVSTGRDAVEEADLLDAGACKVTRKPLDYERIMKEIAVCRAGDGPAHPGGCRTGCPRR